VGLTGIESFHSGRQVERLEANIEPKLFYNNTLAIERIRFGKKRATWWPKSICI